VREPAEQEAFEARFEAAPAVVVIIALQLSLVVIASIRGWTLWFLPGWAVPLAILPEIGLLLALIVGPIGPGREDNRYRNVATAALFGLVSLVNGVLLFALLASLITGGESNGEQLLVKGLVVWASSAITFGLWFWSIDRGGPRRRLERNPPPPDFAFPQLSNPELAEAGWRPRLFDYLYVSLTNAIAFSPTDTMPLTRRAKALMLAEATVSGFTVLLVIARAVNIFT